MKKIIIALGLAVLVGVASYTMYDYNKSSSKQTVPLEKSVNASNEQKNNVFIEKSVKGVTKTKAPDFKLKDLKGKEVSLSEYKGKKVFLNFWATWCPPCRAEMPEMEALYQQIKDSDTVILTVNIGEDENTVQKFITQNKYTFPILLDTDSAVAIDYQIASIPTSYFIDEEGNIVDKHIGAMSKEDMKNYINSIK